MSVVGFDLGTESSVVSVARRARIDVLQNEIGQRLTPSLVAFSGRRRFIGDEASAQAAGNFKNTISNIKRLIGRNFDDPELKYEQQFLSYQLAADKRGRVGVEVAYDEKREVFSIEQIAAALLVKLKGIAEKGLEGQRVRDCVLSCPAWWSDQQRRSLIDSANVAGLNVLRLMNETTAIALSYGFTKTLAPDAKPFKVLFFDMGHSSTNVAVAQFSATGMKILASESDRNLGGRDIDQLLVNHYIEYVKTKYRMDVTTEPKALMKLRNECMRVKKNLSANTKVQFAVEYLMNDRDVTGMIERSEFEGMVGAIIPRICALVDKVLATAKTTKEELFAVEVVGGATRIPAIQNGLTKHMGRELSKTCDSDESVARGCTLMCAMLCPTFRTKDYDVADVTQYAVNLTYGPVGGADEAFGVDPVFTAQNTLPSIKKITFTDGLNPFVATAKYAEPTLIPTGSSPILGRFQITGMPAQSAATTKIKVFAALDINGVVAVTGAELLEQVEEKPVAAAAPAADAAAAADGKAPEAAMDTSADAAKPAEGAAAAAPTKKWLKKAELTVTAQTTSLEQATLQAFYEKEVSMAHQDRLIAETLEARNHVESFILEMRPRIQTDGDLGLYVTDDARNKLNSLLDETENWLYEDGENAQKSEYKKKLDGLKALVDPAVHILTEEQGRSDAINKFKTTLANCQLLLSSSDEKHAHITAADRNAVNAELAAADKWLSDALARQSQQPITKAPVVTCHDITSKADVLQTRTNQVMNKPKPAPPKAEAAPEKPAEPKPEPAQQPESGAQSTSGMETDP